MAYPVLHMKANHISLRSYIDKLEDVMILTTNEFGVETLGRIEGKRGVWTCNQVTKEENKKIGSIGVSVKHWVTSHGFALNVTTDLTYFSHIVACGLQDSLPTSLQHEVKGGIFFFTCWSHRHRP
eukprot:TRINITY_DN2936_c0_g1_i1.p1 TRINITY_DN2936_c0_g1~~TRINITY_DN2936_c0_g1_i1.p1  ORF type:complete len:125 (-),score=20.51 TRINITY_DN2936_c0_g1_i1:220-594(-)